MANGTSGAAPPIAAAWAAWADAIIAAKSASPASAETGSSDRHISSAIASASTLVRFFFMAVNLSVWR